MCRTAGAEVNGATEYARRRFAFTRDRVGRVLPPLPYGARRSSKRTPTAWAAALRGVRDFSNVRARLADRAPVTICLTDKQG